MYFISQYYKFYLKLSMKLITFKIEGIMITTLTNHVQINIRYPSWSLLKVNSTFVYCLISAFYIVQNQSENGIILLELLSSNKNTQCTITYLNTVINLIYVVFTCQDHDPHEKMLFLQGPCHLTNDVLHHGIYHEYHNYCKQN